MPVLPQAKANANQASLVVKVPVLSEQMTVVQPRHSGSLSLSLSLQKTDQQQASILPALIQARSLAQRLDGGQLADDGITLGHLPGKAEHMCFREMFVSSAESLLFIFEGFECKGL